MKQVQKTYYSCVYGIHETPQVADYLYGLKDDCAVYTFSGSLGVGKTTIVQMLLHRYGVTEPVVSPTFTYMQIYHDAFGRKLYHFDLYRLHTIRAFMTAGFDEYLYQPDSWCFIEWPEIIEPLVCDRVCHVSLDYEGLEQRRMTLLYNKIITNESN